MINIRNYVYDDHNLKQSGDNQSWLIRKPNH